MNGLDALLQEILPPKFEGRPCVVGATVANLPEKYQTALQEKLDYKWIDGGHTDFEIASLMQQAGLKASPASVNRHRANKCSCPKE